MRTLIAAVIMLSATMALAGSEAKVNTLTAPSGVRFAMLGAKAAKPSPVIFVFATTAQDSLGTGTYNQTASALVERGFIAVSLDLPGHGDDAMPGEPNALAAWRKRIEQGDNFLPGFLAKARGVLDYLVAEGYADPKRVVASGTSRGGFIAMHFAASDPRVGCVAAFAPVTDLLCLNEFSGMQGNQTATSLALVNYADKLADRSLWICIGNNDRRVGTDSAIAFSRAVVKAAFARSLPAKVDLHVVNGLPHAQGHLVHAGAYKDAANWILGQVSTTGDQ